MLQQVFVSNLGGDPAYLEIFRGLPQSLDANAGLVPRLGHGHFLPYSIYKPPPPPPKVRTNVSTSTLKMVVVGSPEAVNSPPDCTAKHPRRQ
jgi:hypothetical protein